VLALAEVGGGGALGELGLELRPVRVQGGGAGRFGLGLPLPLRAAARVCSCGRRRRSFRRHGRIAAREDCRWRVFCARVFFCFCSLVLC
jgi:hypothetical protein